MNDSCDRELIEQLLTHQEWVRRLAVELAGDPHLGADAAQEAFRRALMKPPVHTSQLRAWLRRVVRSAVRERRRADFTRRAREANAPPPAPESSPDVIVERVQLQRKLVQTVVELPKIQRDVLLLRFFEGCTRQQTAQRLGIPIGTVESRQHRGLATLRARLSAEHGSQGWLPVLLHWIRRGDRNTAAVAGTAATTGGVLMTSLTLKISATAALVALLAAGWLVRHDPLQQDSTPQAASAEPAIEPTNDAAETVARSASPLQPAQLVFQRVEIEPKQDPNELQERGLRIRVSAKGSPATAKLLLYNTDFQLGPKSTNEQGLVQFQPPRASPHPAQLLVLPESGLPELHDVAALMGTKTIVLSQGDARIRGKVLVNGRPPVEPVLFRLTSDRHLDWLEQVPAEIQRLAGLPFDRSSRLQVFTDASGHFEIFNLPNGWQGRLRASSQYWIAPSSQSGLTRTLGLTAPLSALVVRLAELPSIRGQVVENTTGKPLAGMTGTCFVQFQNGERSPWIGFSCDGQGRFHVGVHSVDSDVDFRNRELWPEFERIWVWFDHGGMQPTFEFAAESIERPGDVGVLQLPAGRELEFLVIDQAGDPIAGAMAYARTRSEPTDAAGRGVLQHVPPDTDEITAAAVGFETVTRAFSWTDPMPVVVELPATNSLTVAVNLATISTHNHRLRIRSQPGLFPEDDRSGILRRKLLWRGLFRSATVDGDETNVVVSVPESGLVQLQDLTVGQDLVLELSDRVAGPLASVTVPGLGYEERRTVEIGHQRRPWFLRGQVVEAAGEPVVNARVTYRAHRGETSVRCDHEGRFELGPLYVSRGTLGRVSAQTNSAASRPQMVRAIPSSHVRLEVKPLSTLEATVVDEHGDAVPVSGASVSWAEAESRKDGMKTDLNSFLFRGLPVGKQATVRVRVGGRSYEKQCTTDDGFCNVVVPVHGTLEIRVTSREDPDNDTLYGIANHRKDETQSRYELGFATDGTRTGAQPLLPGRYSVTFENPFVNKPAPPAQEVDVIAGERIVVQF